jgi:hypothetical protein
MQLVVAAITALVHVLLLMLLLLVLQLRNSGHRLDTIGSRSSSRRPHQHRIVATVRTALLSWGGSAIR